MMKVTEHSLSKICIQLYLFAFLNSYSIFPFMKKVNCNQCAETAENFFAECPGCGAQFQYLSPDQRFYRVLGLFSAIAFGAVLTLDDQVGASAANTPAQQVLNQSE
jgi:hypothetical protein